MMNDEIEHQTLSKNEKKMDSYGFLRKICLDKIQFAKNSHSCERRREETNARFRHCILQSTK